LETEEEAEEEEEEEELEELVLTDEELEEDEELDDEDDDEEADFEAAADAAAFFAVAAAAAVWAACCCCCWDCDDCDSSADDSPPDSPTYDTSLTMMVVLLWNERKVNFCCWMSVRIWVIVSMDDWVLWKVMVMRFSEILIILISLTSILYLETSCSKMLNVSDLDIDRSHSSTRSIS